MKLRERRIFVKNKKNYNMDEEQQLEKVLLKCSDAELEMLCQLHDLDREKIKELREKLKAN